MLRWNPSISNITERSPALKTFLAEDAHLFSGRDRQWPEAQVAIGRRQLAVGQQLDQ